MTSGRPGGRATVADALPPEAPAIGGVRILNMRRRTWGQRERWGLAQATVLVRAVGGMDCGSCNQHSPPPRGDS